MSADMVGGAVNAVGGPVMDRVGGQGGRPERACQSVQAHHRRPRRGRHCPSAQAAGRLAKDAGHDRCFHQGPRHRTGGLHQERGPKKSMDMLGQLAGGNSLDNVVNNLAGKTGIDAKQLTGVLGSVAPLVLAGIGGMQAKNGWTTDQLANGITEGVGAMKDAGVVDYVLDNALLASATTSSTACVDLWRLSRSRLTGRLNRAACTTLPAACQPGACLFLHCFIPFDWQPSRKKGKHI